VFEFDGQYGDTVEGEGSHAVDVFQGTEFGLEFIRDLVLDLCRACAGVNDNYIVARRRKFGVLRTRHIEHRA